MKKLLFRLPLLLMLGLISCTDDQPTQSGKAPAIYGTVVDAQGNPVKDAEVRVVFDIEAYASNDTLHKVNGTGLEPVLPNPVSETASLLIVTETGGDTKLKLYRGIGLQDVITTLWDAQIEAGYHQMNFRMRNPKDLTKNLTNGIYIVGMHHNDTTYMRPFFYNNPQNSGAFVNTDAQGKFSLGYGIFEKLPLPRISETGNHVGYFQIGDSATVQIVKNSAKTEWRTKIDKTLIIEKTFTIQ